MNSYIFTNNIYVYEFINKYIDTWDYPLTSYNLKFT